MALTAAMRSKPAEVQFRRVWESPTRNTFSMPSVKGFVHKYLDSSKCSVDPFARNKQWATHTNDIHPDTAAQHHMDAEDYLHMLADQGVICDLGILDPPYSPRQISECYKSMGRKVTMTDTQNAVLYSRVKKALRKVLTDDATVLSFGWNSTGMGENMIEILMVNHGAGRNDTICIAEKLTPNPNHDLFAANDPALAGQQS